MSNQENKHQSGGFFIGFILGVAAALILNTKKGRKILKILIDQGIDKIGNWEDIATKVLNEKDETIDESIYAIPSTTRQIEREPVDLEETKIQLDEPQSETNTTVADAVTRVKTATRRFFRGTKGKR